MFVLWPYSAGDSWQPPGVDQLWVLGMLFSVLICPVSRGWPVGPAWSRSGRAAVLPARTRWLHLATLVLVAALFTSLLIARDAGVMAWLSE